MTRPDRALTEVDIPLEHTATGKVRELFSLDGSLLFVATDRISAFDVVMSRGIPDKGRVLTGMSLFWFNLLLDICANHLISASTDDLPDQLQPHLGKLNGRFMVVRRLEMIPIEFVVRGYLAGSGWKDYRETGAVCGVKLPSGLKEADRLPEPIFTPATKAVTGHDENITEEEAAVICGLDVLKRAKQCAVSIYERAAGIAAERGIILADTKFEFGLAEGDVVLADEVLTPDSSRFWPADEYAPGSSPPSFDKQYLRDWLDESGWDREPPPPDLPDEVVERTRARYLQAYERLTGKSFETYIKEV
ncbi:MAG: phosphoribosylaminoimidazolesuccinocarboxamide synthase [Actinomycetota bacterium]